MTMAIKMAKKNQMEVLAASIEAATRRSTANEIDHETDHGIDQGIRNENGIARIAKNGIETTTMTVRKIDPVTKTRTAGAAETAKQKTKSEITMTKSTALPVAVEKIATVSEIGMVTAMTAISKRNLRSLRKKKT